MKIRPLFDRVLLCAESDEKTDSGILIPRAIDDKSNIMRVVDSGASTEIKTGDRVIVAKYAGTEISHGADKFLLVCEHDILGVIYE